MTRPWAEASLGPQPDTADLRLKTALKGTPMTYNEAPTNETRAAWAREAVFRFAELTRHDGTYIDDTDALAETTRDLFGGLPHLLRVSDVALGPVLLGALSCFAEECFEEGDVVPAPIDALGAACTAGLPDAAQVVGGK